MSKVSIHDYSICITSGNVISPPCTIWRENSLNVNTNCLSGHILPLSIPNEIPSPTGMTLDSLANLFINHTPRQIADVALRNIRSIQQTLTNQRYSTSSSQTRLLSCNQTSINNLSLAASSVQATPGVDAIMLQPMMSGCNVPYPSFCPLFTKGGLFYKFWVSNPNGRPGNADASISNKIRLYLYPGLSDIDQGATVLQKRACNMDKDGRACYELSGQMLQTIGDAAGYSFSFYDLSKSFVIWPLNVAAEWFIGSSQVSAWQTWIVINYDLSSNLISECLPLYQLIPGVG